MAWNGAVLSFTYVPPTVLQSVADFIGQSCDNFQPAVDVVIRILPEHWLVDIWQTSKISGPVVTLAVVSSI